MFGWGIFLNSLSNAGAHGGKVVANRVPVFERAAGSLLAQGRVSDPESFVRRVMKKLMPPLVIRIHGDDLVQQGVVGVLEAERSFDSSRGASVETHAFWQVRKQFTQYFRNAGVADCAVSEALRRQKAKFREVVNDFRDRMVAAGVRGGEVDFALSNVKTFSETIDCLEGLLGKHERLVVCKGGASALVDLRKCLKLSCKCLARVKFLSEASKSPSSLNVPVFEDDVASERLNCLVQGADGLFYEGGAAGVVQAAGAVGEPLEARDVVTRLRELISQVSKADKRAARVLELVLFENLSYGGVVAAKVGFGTRERVRQVYHAGVRELWRLSSGDLRSVVESLYAQSHGESVSFLKGKGVPDRIIYALQLEGVSNEKLESRVQLLVEAGLAGYITSGLLCAGERGFASSFARLCEVHGDKLRLLEGHGVGEEVRGRLCLEKVSVRVLRVRLGVLAREGALGLVEQKHLSASDSEFCLMLAGLRGVVDSGSRSQLLKKGWLRFYGAPEELVASVKLPLFPLKRILLVAPFVEREGAWGLPVYPVFRCKSAARAAGELRRLREVQGATAWCRKERLLSAAGLDLNVFDQSALACVSVDEVERRLGVFQRAGVTGVLKPSYFHVSYHPFETLEAVLVPKLLRVKRAKMLAEAGSLQVSEAKILAVFDEFGVPREVSGRLNLDNCREELVKRRVPVLKQHGVLQYAYTRLFHWAISDAVFEREMLPALLKKKERRESPVVAGRAFSGKMCLLEAFEVPSDVVKDFQHCLKNISAEKLELRLKRFAREGVIPSARASHYLCSDAGLESTICLLKEFSDNEKKRQLLLGLGGAKLLARMHLTHVSLDSLGSRARLLASLIDLNDVLPAWFTCSSARFGVVVKRLKRAAELKQECGVAGLTRFQVEKFSVLKSAGVSVSKALELAKTKEVSLQRLKARLPLFTGLEEELLPSYFCPAYSDDKAREAAFMLRRRAEPVKAKVALLRANGAPSFVLGRLNVRLVSASNLAERAPVIGEKKLWAYATIHLLEEGSMREFLSQVASIEAANGGNNGDSKRVKLERYGHSGLLGGVRAVGEREKLELVHASARGNGKGNGVHGENGNGGNGNGKRARGSNGDGARAFGGNRKNGNGKGNGASGGNGKKGGRHPELPAPLAEQLQ